GPPTATAQRGVTQCQGLAFRCPRKRVQKHLAPVITLRDLHPLDILVLRDLVRFGVLANDHIQRRYGNTAISTDRLVLLESRGFINKPRAEVIQNTVIYTATRYG